jgi:predicted dehydrogenase
MSPPRIVIAGTGAFAVTHAEALARQSRLALGGFVGQRPDSGIALAQRFGGRAHRDLAEVLEDPAVAGLIVATPHDSHMPIGIAALSAGKCVLIEKPLGLDTSECDALIAAEQASSARGMVGHLMRWAPAHIEARRLIADGAIGDLVSIEGRRIIAWGAHERRDWHKQARTGGGMWMVQGVHVIDQMTWLADAPVTAALGIAATRFHPGQEADDFGAALCDMGGVLGTIRISGTSAPVAAQVFTELHGTGGLLRVSHRGEVLIDTGGGWRALTDTTVNHWHANLDGEIAAFADVVEGAAAETGFTYGRRIVAVVEAVRRSQLSRQWESVA